MASISERENREIEAASASGNTPVVFIHGLWLLPGSWASLGGLLQAGRLRAADAELARRSGNG
jgi:pimeloyl-ACP methyl ester carboxylesterase